MNKLIEWIKGIVAGKFNIKFKSLAKADDILEDFFSVAGKLDAYADVKAKVATEVQEKRDALKVELKDAQAELDKAIVFSTKIRGLLND